jgi:alpha-galactosidase
MRYADIHGEFRDAMAAPAGLPEFGNSVIAVRTEQFWDLELDELRRKDAQLKKTLRQRREAGELTDAEVKELLEKKRSEMFTPRERKILADGASNFEFHYLGSAKILGQIGKKFAEALYPIAAKK